MIFTRPQQIQAALITLGALAIFWIFRNLPTGTNLSHMDFRVQGGSSIEMCECPMDSSTAKDAYKLCVEAQSQRFVLGGK
jgi:hypothetical protein